ncbi:MAG: hypothetical protein Fur0044_16730 [Anaerolineae bacterium]|nr:hypothetical protein [Anaerolineales bacterium]MCQ3977996.1 hypothetical protein [Anaerolineae bacterium]
MTTLYIEPVQEAGEVLPLIQSAIESEIARLELALKMAEKRLGPFEQKYGVTSDYFMAEMVAEDLAGGDEEYVSWAGEYKLKQRLQEKLRQLQEISYGHTDLLRPGQNPG